jgi:hypothetical protein
MKLGDAASGLMVTGLLLVDSVIQRRVRRANGHQRNDAMRSSDLSG